MPASSGAPNQRARLISAAEELFFERGLENVSLREITDRAGARNASAVQYHLGDRDGVIAAILAKHLPDIESRRSTLLDDLDARDTYDVRDLAGAYVRPLAAQLEVEGGPGYLQVVADLVNRPDPVLDGTIATPTTDRWRSMVAPRMAPGGKELHQRFTAMQFTLNELARRAHAAPAGDQRLFTSHLVDLVSALLAAPISAETRRLRRRRA